MLFIVKYSKSEPIVLSVARTSNKLLRRYGLNARQSYGLVTLLKRTGVDALAGDLTEQELTASLLDEVVRENTYMVLETGDTFDKLLENYGVMQYRFESVIGRIGTAAFWERKKEAPKQAGARKIRMTKLAKESQIGWASDFLLKENDFPVLRNPPFRILWKQ